MGARALGLSRLKARRRPALLLAAALLAPRAACAAWMLCWFDDHHDRKLFYSLPFQATETELLRNQTIFEANVFMNGATTAPDTICRSFASRGGAEARIAALRQQARSAGEQPNEIPAE